MNRGALTALIIILLILAVFALLYQRGGVTQTGVTPTSGPTTVTVSPTTLPSESGSPSPTTLPTTILSPTRGAGVTVAPTSY